MVCLGLEPGAAGWKAQTNPLSYGGTPKYLSLGNSSKNILTLRFASKLKSYKAEGNY